MIYNDIREQIMVAVLAATGARRNERDAELTLWDDGDDSSEATYDSFSATMSLRLEARQRTTDSEYGTAANALYASMRYRLFRDQNLRQLVTNMQIGEMTISEPEAESNIWGIAIILTVDYRHLFDDLETQ